MIQSTTNWTTITILFTCIFLFVTVYVKWIFNYWKRQRIPYLKPSIPMENFEPPWAIKKGYHMNVADLHNELKDNGHKYGGIFSLFRPIFLPIDLDLLKNLMIKDFQHFDEKGFYYNEVHDPMSAHLFSIGGEKWKLLRTKLSPTFTSGRMKAMFQLVLGCANSLEKEVQKLFDKNLPVNIKEMGALFTTDVIGTCAFGLDTNCFDNPNNEFRLHTKTFFDGGFVHAVRFLFTQSFPDFSRKVGIKVFASSTTDFYYDVVKNVVKHRESSNITRNDFVHLLLEIKKGGANTLTMNEIAAQCFVFFLAGFETSSSTMTFAFFEMAKNQEIQDKVRAEVRRVLKKYDGKICYDAIMEMTYMQQVFDETLRKYPIVATLDRLSTKDYKIPNEDIVLKKNTKVLISLQAIHHDPKHYPNPEEFDPERFTPENKAKRHPCAYMPFGEGPRICIGMRFGIMQAKVGMAIMLKEHRYTLAKKCSELELKPTTPILAPLSGVFLNIEKI